MAKIPQQFIDELVGRVDIVDIIDRRVPLTRKGKEFMACCPFHEEKTPSFTVSQTKQFYHCFGCGAHGTAIGFLMDYANLSFIEAVEQLADTIGMSIPQAASGKSPAPPGESAADLRTMVEKAKNWFQQQLRNHPDGQKAIDYLKNRGLDGKTAVEFAIGFAPDSWTDLADAIGTNEQSRKQLLKIGLVSDKKNNSGQTHYYDRFRGRIIFPIADDRGRTVGFGGRIIGDGEPKYLNSPETLLFHKGADFYGLHRARRAIGKQSRSIVVEGYMDVISLVQFGVENTVATLGTATTDAHIDRLFRLADEVIFCFDGDRAGTAAAWKALQVALPKMSDGRQVGFLFLEQGEDPDSTVRKEGKDGFNKRLADAKPLPDFLFDTLTAQVNLGRADGKAKLVSLAKPLINELPDGTLKAMMLSKLSFISGLATDQLASKTDKKAAPGRRPRHTPTPEAEQLSPLAQAISLLLQNPPLGRLVEDLQPLKTLKTLDIQGADVLLSIMQSVRDNESITTAQLVESFRDSRFHDYLEKLAMRRNLIAPEHQEQVFLDIIDRLVEHANERIRLELLEKARVADLSGMKDDEKQELVERLKARFRE